MCQDEIINAKLPPPFMNQIELSPFNQHKDVREWAKQYDMKLSCAAWANLSSGKNIIAALFL